MNLKTNPELLPLVEWWEKDGKSTVIWLLVAAIAVGGWYGWKNHKAAVKAAASDALVNAYTTEEIEDAVAKFSGSATEGALKLRLAKNYFDAGRYEEALAQYEALGKFDEAAKAFDAFAEANPKSYLKLTAQLGAARAIAQAGDKKKALARIDALKVANTDDEVAKARIEATEAAIKRLGQKAPPPPAAKPEAGLAATNAVKKVESK